MVLETLNRVYQALLVFNAGGAVAILGYMGALKGAVPTGAKISLALFLFGILLYGLFVALIWHHYIKVKFSWLENSEKFIKNEIEWEELVRRHRSIASGVYWWFGWRWDLIFAYGSFFLGFILGSVFGIASILY